MRRGALLPILLLPMVAACVADRLSVLDHELQAYKVENERIRREDLEDMLEVEEARNRDLTERILELRDESADLAKNAESLEKAIDALKMTIRHLEEEKSGLEGEGEK